MAEFGDPSLDEGLDFRNRQEVLGRILAALYNLAELVVCGPILLSHIIEPPFSARLSD